MRTLAVVAIGGNALVRPGEPTDVASQRANLDRSAGALGRLAQQHRLILTHGNGPQVGLLALQSASQPDFGPHPLDVLDAESVGLIGYLLVQALSAHVDPAGVTAVLTRVEVDADDPAFDRPTKPVGPWYPPDRSAALAAEHGWDLVTGPRGARRVVPSPEPLSVVEARAIRALVADGQVVVAGGGGGIPVTYEAGRLVGVEAVVDKDLTAALIATELRAARLVVLTDIDAVYLDHGLPTARPLTSTTPEELRGYQFEQGSMGPKVEAVCRFVEQTGGEAAIGALDEAEAVLAGAAGTTIRAGGSRDG